MNHVDHLRALVPDLLRRRVLDIGSGRGDFLIALAERGVSATGLELYDAYRTETLRKAREHGLSVSVVAGVAEKLPFADGFFDFVNMGEVLEHVEDPARVMREIFRVLTPEGRGYVSAPNRFGLRDQHFRLYFVNWLPRSLSESFIRLFGAQKTYGAEAGRQRLGDMHYYTWRGVSSLAARAGFEVVDIRGQKVRARFGPLALPLYYVARAVYFDAFHLLVHKKY